MQGQGLRRGFVQAVALWTRLSIADIMPETEYLQGVGSTMQLRRDVWAEAWWEWSLCMCTYRVCVANIIPEPTWSHTAGKLLISFGAT